MKSLLNKLFKGALGLALVAGLGTDAFAQTFNSNGAGAKYNASCGGVIRMRAAGGAFTNTNSATLGTSATPIPGAVDWAATTGTQTVQGLYYERMVISGASTKTIATGVNITGGVCATVPALLVGYENLGTYSFYIATGAGDNTFAGTFTYTGANDQTIYPVYTVGIGGVLSTTNNYNILAIQGTGITTIAGNVGATELNSDANSKLTVTGNVYLGNGVSDIAGTLTINDVNAKVTVGASPGALNLNNATTITAGSLIVPDGGAGAFGTVTVGASGSLALGGSTSILNFGTNSNLVITGSISNTGDGTNLTFDCSSNVTYNAVANGQLIMPTLASTLALPKTSYGNLTLTGGNKIGGSGINYTGVNKNDINLCSNFSVTGPNLTMTTNGGTFAMNTSTATATYAGNEEVIGNFARVTDATKITPYVFNNANTTVTLAASANNPSLITMGVQPGVNPNQYAATDVKRKVNLAYTGAAATPFAMTMRVGYLEGEGTWTATNTQASLRMYEASSAAFEKIATSNAYARGPAAGTTLGYVELAGIGGSTVSATLPNGNGLFASGNDVLLRAGAATFYTIADGRWTNTETWDEKALPTANDNVVIRHMVYAGIAGPFAGTLIGGNTTTELSKYADGKIASTITIDDIARASFIIGNEDNGASYTLMTTASGESFTNNNVDNTHQMLSFGTGILGKGTFSGTSAFNGLWLTPWGNTGNQQTIFRTNTLQNNNGGTVNVEGILELGN